MAGSYAIAYERPDRSVRYAFPPMPDEVVKERREVPIDASIMAARLPDGGYIGEEVLDDYMALTGGWRRA